MKKALVLLLIVFIMSTFVAARENRAEPFTGKGMNSIYLELLGNGFLATLNYEKFLTNELGLRVGGMIIPTSSGVTYTGTIMGTMLSGKGKWLLEGGLGVMIIGGEFIDFITEEGRSRCFAFTGTLGLRYQPKRNGMIFRLGFTPIFAPSGGGPWIGVSIGYSFK